MPTNADAGLDYEEDFPYCPNSDEEDLDEALANSTQAASATATSGQMNESTDTQLESSSSQTRTTSKGAEQKTGGEEVSTGLVVVRGVQLTICNYYPHINDIGRDSRCHAFKAEDLDALYALDEMEERSTQLCTEVTRPSTDATQASAQPSVEKAEVQEPSSEPTQSSVDTTQSTTDNNNSPRSPIQSRSSAGSSPSPGSPSTAPPSPEQTTARAASSTADSLANVNNTDNTTSGPAEASALNSARFSPQCTDSTSISTCITAITVDATQERVSSATALKQRGLAGRILT